MGLKHSKYKNTGILFELLVRQITTDTLNESESKAASLLKKYFIKTELGKEYKLYEILSRTQLTESKANLTLNSVLESSAKLDKEALKKQKYHLIREIKNNYNLEDFFKTKLPNYKVHASLYNLLEAKANPEEIINNKMTILEHLTTPKEVEDEELKELNEDKGLRILTYKLLLEKFNVKYDNLNHDQKVVLKEYISNIDNFDRLKLFYNEQVGRIKGKLKLITENIDDQSVSIKLKEIDKLLVEVDKKSKVTNDNLVNLLQYYDLIHEFK
mgnify:CR=1 FL=1